MSGTKSPERISEGFRPNKGDVVYLCHGVGDSRRELSYFTADGEWACPQTVNGHWYGVLTKAELEAEIRNFV